MTHTLCTLNPMFCIIKLNIPHIVSWIGIHLDAVRSLSSQHLLPSPTVYGTLIPSSKTGFEKKKICFDNKITLMHRK